MILHAADAVRDGFHKIMVHTVETDVVVLPVAAAARMSIQAVSTTPFTMPSYSKVVVMCMFC